MPTYDEGVQAVQHDALRHESDGVVVQVEFPRQAALREVEAEQEERFLWWFKQLLITRALAEEQMRILNEARAGLVKLALTRGATAKQIGRLTDLSERQVRRLAKSVEVPGL